MRFYLILDIYENVDVVLGAFIFILSDLILF